MAPPQDFIDYPRPEEGPKVEYTVNAQQNPVLRGLPLLIASHLISRSGFLQSILWTNAGFGKIKDLPELDDLPFRFHPCVTPLGDSKMLDFEPQLLKTTAVPGKNSYYTAADYHQMYKSGTVTPLQVAETLLAAIKQDQNPPSKYADAWAELHGKDELALQAAKESTERYAAGKDLGILDGVPIGVKDDTAVKGYVNHFGMKYKAGVPYFKEQDESLWSVQKLIEAGAVVIGKNRMHELGSDTSGLNVAQGSPTNHCNPAYYTGGSTSGGASALGAGTVPIVVGTDAGGSIRIPATFNGVYGLKPSHHRMGHFNMTMAVRGPLAASANDLTIAYRLMAQPDPECPVSGRFGTSKVPEAGAPRVMGVYREWWAEADPRVAEVCNKAIDYFAKKRGYEVIDISIPRIAESRIAHGLICIAEMAEGARRRTPNPADWLSLSGAANRLLLSSATQTPAADYIKCNTLREMLMRHLAWLFQEHPGLMIMTPTSPMIGWARSAGDESYGVSDTNTSFHNMMYIFLANMAGNPAVSAPVGYVEPDQGEGEMPIGMMAMGEWGAEEQLLEWAREAEEYLNETYEGGRRRPKTWFDVLGKAQKKD